MTRLERMKEILKASPDFGKRVGYKMCVVDELHDIKELEKEEPKKNHWYEMYTLECLKTKELEKENAELEKEISILLSCKNCPENKGGYICQKEYENKCLAQKIQYIKELQEENAELEKESRKLAEIS